MLNRVMLIGNLGADPDVRYTPGGDPIATLRLATTRRWKDRNTNERKEETEWHRVVFFGALAKVAADYLKKGSQLYVSGRIRTQKWTDKEGQERFTTDIVGEELNMLGGKSDGGNTQNNSVGKEKNSGHSYSGNNGYPEDFDDDIPF